MPRSLYISVQGTDAEMYAPGLFPPKNLYSINVEVYNYAVESTVVEAYAQLEGGMSLQGIVIADNFKFFEVRVSESATDITVRLQVLFGEVTMYISYDGKPTQAVCRGARARATVGRLDARHTAPSIGHPLMCSPTKLAGVRRHPEADE